ncbi:hypothetical protein ACLOJK_033924 [Asimina triloba]
MNKNVTPHQQLHESWGASNELTGLKANCSAPKLQNPSESHGYIDYRYIFYCVCERYPVLGYLILFLSLLVLFYLLGNTASLYFCPALENLSRLLNLSPAIAGVTLLSLGNGAPDAFATIVSFMGPGSARNVGLNSVLGGAFFVSSVVVGIICILVAPHRISIEKLGFLRDVCFLILAQASLLVILIVGKIGIIGAIAFASLYAVYVVVVAVTHLQRAEEDDDEIGDVDSEGHPHRPLPTDPELGELGYPLLDAVEKPNSTDQRAKASCLRWFLMLIEMPLYLPRRLTIPVVCEERWSKPYAVISATLAPVLLAALWKGVKDMGSEASLTVYAIGGLVGLILGSLALATTNRRNPPKRCLLLWLAGGFMMSVVWTYVAAQELVALMVTVGDVLGISSSILGLTVLAWGNSVGDLIANLAMALNGGREGAQIAIAGCYAGPVFNTLVGLGLSLLFSTWRAYPSSVQISTDVSLFETMGFVAGGLFWALLILPKRGMKLDRVLGVGLLSIYICFISLRLGQYLWSL